MKITSMSGTSFHSIAMFLAASDLPEYQVAQEIWKIRSLIKLNP